MLLTLLRQAWLSIYCIKKLGVDVKGFHHTGLKIALTGHVTIYEPRKYLKLPSFLLIMISQGIRTFVLKKLDNHSLFSWNVLKPGQNVLELPAETGISSDLIS